MHASPVAQLDAENALVCQLFAILNEEQDHLVNARIDELPGVTERKSSIVADLSRVTELRYQLLQAQGFVDGEIGMKNWLQAQVHDSNLHAKWMDMLETAKRAKELNRINGLLLGKHASMTKAALNVLRGANSAGVYGPDGQTRSAIRSRGLALG